MEIRPAHKKDVRAIYTLVRGATLRGKILKRPMREIAANLGHFWVAEEDGRVIACCSLEIYNKKLAEMRSLVVDAAHQGKGIASALVKQLKREAKKRRIYEVLVITDRERLFKRLGFAEQLHGQSALFLRPLGKTR